MKKILLFALPLTLIFIGCKKENPAESLNTPQYLTTSEKSVVRYEFSSNRAATYGFATETNEQYTDERVNTAVYSKTITVNGPVKASFVIYPPEEWANTGITSTITLKIFVNDREIASKTAEMYWADRHPGVKLTASMQ